MGANRPFRELLPLNDEEVIIISDHIALSSSPLHFHHEYELVFFNNCKGLELTIGSLREKANNTELALIAPNVPHGWKFSENRGKESRIFTINFNERFLVSISGKKNSNSLFSDGFSTIVFSAKTVHHLSEKLTALMKQKKKNGKAELRSILQFLAISPDKRTIFGTKETIDPEITALDKYLITNYNKKITLNDACNFTQMSPSSFNRYINKYTGRPFIAYFNNIRLAVSARQLCETDEKVASIAAFSGFTNLANFNRLFKNRYGLTPLKYRQLYFGRKIII